MKSYQWLLIAVIFLLRFRASATVHYVNQAGTTPLIPYTSWASAATNIQDAVSNCISGDTVLVTNGIYQTGGSLIVGSNRVYIFGNITVQSVNGPAFTTIKGIQVPGALVGATAMRCVYIADASTLSGFTLTGGATTSLSQNAGGGIRCNGPSSIVSNCVITANASFYQGGGACSGTYINCTFSNNTAPSGGGGACSASLINCVLNNNSSTSNNFGGGAALSCSLTNCLLTGNFSIAAGGAVVLSTLVNCTLVSNTAATTTGVQGSIYNNCISYYNYPDNGSTVNSFTNCCLTPLPPGTLGANNFTNAPSFVDLANGNYRLQIGSVCINAGNNSLNTNSTDLDGNPRVVGGTIDVGAYENSFTGTAHYVSLNSANPTTPYLSWSTAATNIQDAVNSATAGDYVVADAGVYASGGMVLFGSETNRVVLTNGVTLLSLNGPQSTLIVGGLQMRGVYVGSNSFLSGFTITNGQTRLTGDVVHEQSGGGIWCEPGGGVSNCIVVSNFAGSGANTSTTRFGGGIFGGAISNCVIVGNFGGSGGGAASNVLWNCTLSNNLANLGGAVCGSTIYSSLISSNTAIYNGISGSGGGTYQCVAFNTSIKNNNSTGSGGGTYQGTNFNCLIVSNVATTSGGGTYQSTNYDCAISFNTCFQNGGGVYGGWHYNCVINGNIATNSQGLGGGVYAGTNVNCTIVGNTGLTGGGIYNSPAYNSIIYYNSASSGSNFSLLPLMDYCCTTPNPGSFGCFTNDPGLLDWTNGFFQLKCGSACIDAGFSNSVIFVTTNDFRGLPRPVDGNNDGTAKFDVGAYEYTPAVDLVPLIRSLSSYSTIATGYTIAFAAAQGNCANFYWWDFGDGTPTVTNQNIVSHSWATAGTYTVKLSAFFSSGLVLSSTVQVQVVSTIYYVNPTSQSPLAPYTSWITAAHTIEPAIAASTTPGRLVLVTNGTYQTPSFIVFGNQNNLVVLTNPVIVQSVNGPALTVLNPTSGRCAYVGSNSLLNGFMLKSGRTISTGDIAKEQSGGGAWCEPGGVVSNCVMAGCSANQNGGGAYQGTFYNCTFTNNFVSQYGGGAFLSILNNCSVSNNFAQFGGGVSSGIASNSVISSNRVSSAGGGAYSNSLVNCVLSANLATNFSFAYGGGAYICRLTNCTLSGNSASSSGGGAFGSSLTECLVVGNLSVDGGGVIASVNAPSCILNHCTVYGNSASGNGGGLSSGDSNPPGHVFATNCIIFGNSATNGSNYFASSASTLTLASCCTSPLPATGAGNIVSDPFLVNPAGGDFHLQSNSPCINAGLNSAVITTTDFDGNPRIVAGAVDIGAYEFQTPASVLSYAWAQQYGLATDGSADYADTDGDGMNNWQEWKSGTAPTDPTSILKMSSVSNSASGTTVTWQSVSGIKYYLQRSANLGAQPAFSSIASNLVGQVALTSFIDTAVTNGGPYYYRIGVQ